MSHDYMIKHGVLKSLALYAHAGSEVFLPDDWGRSVKPVPGVERQESF